MKKLRDEFKETSWDPSTARVETPKPAGLQAWDNYKASSFQRITSPKNGLDAWKAYKLKSATKADNTTARSTGLDDNSLAYQMLKDAAASEKSQQSQSITQRMENLTRPGAASVSDYAGIVKSFVGTPAQDAYNDYLRQRTNYSALLNAPDFAQYSQQGANIQNPSFDDAQGYANLFGWRPGAAEVGNIVTFSRANLGAIKKRLASDDRSDFIGDALYGFMTEDEVGIYNYLLAKEGKESAQRYLDSIVETLNNRYGEEIAGTVEKTKGTVLHPVMTAGMATSSGLDQWAGGVKQAFNEYEQPTSAIQYAGQKVREQQGTLGKFAYDAVNTLSNMAPSILASYVAAGLGAPAAVAEWVAAGSLGLGSGGNAYKQALAEGRSKDEAKTVAALTGASEAVLSKVLSGVGAFGGLTPEKLLPKVAAIEKAIWRVAAAGGVKIGGEITEEVAQLYLEPLFKTLIYGDEYDLPAFEEVAYTALLTAATTGLLEGGDIAKYRTQKGAHEAAGIEYPGTAQNGVETVGDIQTQGQSENAPAAAEIGAAGVNSQSNATTQQQERAIQAVLDAMPKKETARQSSAGAFVEAGDDAITAARKGEIMDRVLAGDQTLTNTRLRELHMNTPTTRKAFEKLTGTAVPMTTDTKTLLSTARAVLDNAAQRNSTIPTQTEVSVPAETPTSQETPQHDSPESLRADFAQENKKVSELDTKTENTQPGFYPNETFSGVSGDKEYLDRLAKAAGVSIQMSQQNSGSNGWIVNGKVYISESAEDPIRVVAKHEITHHLQDAAEGSYMQYRGFVEQIFRERGTLEQQLQAIQELYARNGHQLTQEQALDELAADFSGELIEDEILIRRLAGEDRNLAQRILDAIRDIVRRVRTAFSSAEVRQLDRAARLWETALAETNAAYRRGEVEVNQNVRYAFADKKIPTYDELIAKPDVKVVDIQESDKETAFSEQRSNLKKDANVRAMYDAPVLNKDTGEYIFVTPATITHSFSNPGVEQFSAILSLRDIIENAVLTHAEPTTHGADNTTGIYTLFAAIRNENGISPVKLKVKEYYLDGRSIPENIQKYFDKNGVSDPYASVYDSRVLVVETIEKEDASSSALTYTEKSSIQGKYPSASSEISVRDLLALVNTEYQKYVPQAKHSVKGSREMQRRIDALERQNKRLKEQMKRTDAPRKNRKAVEAVAESLRKEFWSQIDAKELTDRLDSLYHSMHMKGGSEYGHADEKAKPFKKIKAEAKSIAVAIMEESMPNANPLCREVGELRWKLRGMEISIPEKARNELTQYGYGGYDDFAARNKGRLKLTEEGRDISSLYNELSEQHPDLFPDDVFTAGEQLVRIGDVIQDLEMISQAYSEKGPVVDFIAGEILERFYQTPRHDPTWADKEYLKRERQRVKDRKILRAEIKAHAAQHEQNIKKLHERYAKANLKRIENQNAAERRETIYRHAFRLGKKLLRPTNKQHVPEGLRGATINLLQYINLESGFEYEFAQDDTYRRVVPGSVLGAEKTNRTLAAIELREQLGELAKKEILCIDPELDDRLRAIAGMGGKTLKEMSREELDVVWEVLQTVEKTIIHANEMHSEGRYQHVSEMADAIERDNGDKKDRVIFSDKGLGAAIGTADKLINFDMLTPDTFLHQLGESGDELFKMMRKAEDRQIAILEEGVEKAKTLVEESGVDFSKLDKELHTFDLKGGSITLSTSQIMELYALTKREQAREHIFVGGLMSIGASKGITEKGNAQPVTVTLRDVSEMIGKLTDQQKKLMDGLQNYFSTTLAEHGNAETMKVYGYRKFKEEYYWPIKVGKTETRSDPTSKIREKTIPGYGMTKLTQPDAENPVELRSALTSFSNHLNQMSTYAAWLGTNEDITRVLNYQFLNEETETENEDSTAENKDEPYVRNTVKRILKSVYGKNGETYLENLLGDIAQGTKAGQEKAVTDVLTGNWKAAKVGGNLRVVVQQPTAIIRAAAMLDPKYFLTKSNPKQGWEKAKKYSKIAQWKDWGYFELDTGRSLRELIDGESAIDKVKNGFMWAAGAADSVTWGHLWNAVENETADLHPEFEKNSEAFYQAAAERFGEIIDRTQVVDSVLHRTQIMRSGNALNKMATSFMSEPSKVYNMVARSVFDLVNAKDENAKKRAFKAAARSSAALIVSFGVNAVMQSLIDALRDDDREKEFGEKFAESYFGFTGEEESFGDYFTNFWDGNFQQNFNPFGYIPYVKDVASIIQGYSVDRSDMASATELVNALRQLGKSISGEGQKTVLSTGMDAANKLADLFGLPISNLKRDIAAIVSTILNEAELYELQYTLDKLVYDADNASGVFYGDIYRSMNDDLDAYEDIYEDFYEGMIERGLDEEEAQSKLKNAMETKMKDELGIKSVKSLPVRWSPPSEKYSDDVKIQKFFQLLQIGEGNGGWSKALDKEVVDLAHEVDAVRDGTNLERAMVIAESESSEQFKEFMMMITFEGDALVRYLTARKAGISTKEFVDVLAQAAEIAKARGVKKASQEDVKAALSKSGLTGSQKRAIWNSYIATGVWKAKSPW